MMSSRMHVQSLVMAIVVVASGCATANVGGDVSSAPVTVPATEGPVSPLPAPVIGGAPVTAADPSVLRRGVWVLIGLGETDVTPAVRNPAHLSFAEATRVTGATGCNRLSGGVTVDERSLRFGALVTTRMACPGGGDLETRFLKALEATRSWGIEAGTLHLRNAEGDSVAALEHRDAVPGA